MASKPAAKQTDRAAELPRPAPIGIWKWFKNDTLVKANFQFETRQLDSYKEMEFWNRLLYDETPNLLNMQKILRLKVWIGVYDLYVIWWLNRNWKRYKL